MATDCWSSLNLAAVSPGSFNDTETALDAAATAARTAWDIADIGYTLLMLDGTFIPVLGFISLGLDVYTIIGMFSGRPQFEDTNNVIWAYNMSAYWPLHALATDLKIAEKNGAPISDSNPAIQAQFSAWKQGAIISIQQLAGWSGGPADPGYWQLQRLLNYSWSQSGGGQQAVLNVVRVIDRFTQILACLFQQQASKPPPPPPSGGAGGGGAGGGGGAIPCDSGNLDQDEILDFCQATQTSLQQILAAIQALNSPTGGNGIDPCCAAVVNAIGNVTAQLANITAILVGSSTTPAPLDLTPIITELANLASAIGAYPPALQACCAAITGQLGNIASAISNSGTDTAGIVKALQALFSTIDVPLPVYQQLAADGFISSSDLQLVGSGEFGAGLMVILRKLGWYAIQFWATLVGGKFLPDGSFQWTAWGLKHDNNPESALSVAFNAASNLLEPQVAAAVRAMVGLLTPPRLPVIGDVHVNPDVVLAKLVTTTIGLHLAAGAFTSLDIGAAEEMTGLVERIIGLLGFEELRDVQIGPLMKYGIARTAELRAKGTYRQEIAGIGTMASWTARGLYPAARYQGLAPLSGTPPEQVDPTLQAAYGGLGIRRLLPLIRTGLFTQADLIDEMTFAAIRPASQRRMLLAAPYMATAPERNSLRATLEKAYIAGLMDDPTLTSNVDSSEHNTDRDNLILQRVKWEVLIQETKDFEAEYTTLYLGQVINDVTYRSYLSGIGLQPWKINSVAAKAEARAAATLQRQAIRDAQALQRATAAEERKAAMHNFANGNINAASLGVALVATGLTPTQALAWVDLATLQRAGSLRWKYGLQLSPAEAVLLGERVTALLDQRKRQQISDPAFVAALQALNIPPRYINALQATADALLTPKVSAFAIPVQTG